MTPTPGHARITWHQAKKPGWCWPSATAPAAASRHATCGHSPPALPPHGVTVALVEQPWRVAGKKLAPAPKTLDVGWRGVWPALAEPGLPVVSGGRSAGARVACRTAAELGAHAVLALSFPLHPPGQAGEVPRRGTARRRGAHPRRPGRQRPVREAGGVPRRRVRTGRGAARRSRASRCPSGRRSAQEEAVAAWSRHAEVDPRARLTPPPAPHPRHRTPGIPGTAPADSQVLRPSPR